LKFIKNQILPPIHRDVPKGKKPFPLRGLPLKREEHWSSRVYVLDEKFYNLMFVKEYLIYRLYTFSRQSRRNGMFGV
jgi:hypothetical protein